MKLVNKDSLDKIININTNEVEEFMYNFLSINKDFILENTTEFTIDDLWYSEYYWLSELRKKKNKYDAGMDQQLFELLEMMNINIDIDWNIIEDIEENNIKI